MKLIWAEGDADYSGKFDLAKKDEWSNLPVESDANKHVSQAGGRAIDTIALLPDIWLSCMSAKQSSYESYEKTHEYNTNLVTALQSNTDGEPHQSTSILPILL